VGVTLSREGTVYFDRDGHANRKKPYLRQKPRGVWSSVNAETKGKVCSLTVNHSLLGEGGRQGKIQRAGERDAESLLKAPERKQRTECNAKRNFR